MEGPCPCKLFVRWSNKGRAPARPCIFTSEPAKLKNSTERKRQSAKSVIENLEI